LIDALLQIADELLSQTDVSESHLRRATSTAYYAAFHALCKMLASQIVPDENSELFVRLYRHVNHNQLDGNKALFKISDETNAIRTQLDDLRQRRIEADYIPAKFPYEIVQVKDFVNSARTVVALIRSLTENDRIALAVNLLIGTSKQRAVG